MQVSRKEINITYNPAFQSLDCVLLDYRLKSQIAAPWKDCLPRRQWAGCSFCAILFNPLRSPILSVLLLSPSYSWEAGTGKDEVVTCPRSQGQSWGRCGAEPRFARYLSPVPNCYGFPGAWLTFRLFMYLTAFKWLSKQTKPSLQQLYWALINWWIIVYTYYKCTVDKFWPISIYTHLTYMLIIKIMNTMFSQPKEHLCSFVISPPVPPACLSLAAPNVLAVTLHPFAFAH